MKVLEAQLRNVIQDGHAQFARALDPLAEDGAVARFIRSLREELKGAEEDRSRQISTALAALNANDENSLINRLVRETDRARQDVLAAVNPDVPQSAMAVLRASLTNLLNEQHARQESFEKEVREALARIETKRSQDQVSPRGGFDFEDAVIKFVSDRCTWRAVSG